MGCFLSCFRGGSGPSGDLQHPLARESRIGDAFLSDEKSSSGVIDEELRREANYLKSCGTISQTPAEILDSIPVNSEDANEANYLKSCGTISQTPAEILGSIPINSEDTTELIKDAELLEENSPELLNSEEHDVLRQAEEIDEDTFSVVSETQSSSEEKPLCQNVRDQQSTDSSDSPYPTPLVLRGDIQTPGTVYTANKETLKPGKRTRASRHFIYPVLRPIENKMQWMELKAESPVVASNPTKRRNLSTDSSEKTQQTLGSSTVTETESSEYVSFPIYDSCAVQNELMSPEETKGQSVNQQQYEGEDLSKESSEHGKPGVTSLSHWIKSSSADEESNSSPDDGNAGKETWYETSASDVPIFPAFGLNWETDNPTPVLPKAWDGNGIPNTTTKYKEDQKISWHATPFEERLMKVLSDEGPRYERKFSGKLIHLEENAE